MAMREKPKFVLIYWRQNDDTLVETPDYKAVKMYFDCEWARKAEWEEGETPYGKWRCRFYVTDMGMLLEREWVPKPGYAWYEREVYRVTI